ncbi:MAG: pyridoxamine 5'-phosphate oxidase family protein [Anaerolineales bacterium]|nr:pyridoxamine 5'-phosphate oxidase family protein [Anaerolineales bacterium]
MSHTDPAINQVRLAERAQDDAWIRSYLQKAQFGMLATEWQGQPFLKPTLFAYEPETHAIYFHGALEGRMRQNIAANPRVCFSTAEMGRLVPGDTAMEFGVEYASVVVFGTVHVIDDPVEARRALQMLLDRYFPTLRPGIDYREIVAEELAVTAVYRLDISLWSGKEAPAAENP